MRTTLLALLALVATANAFTLQGGESDTSSSLWWFVPAAGCAAGAAGTNWDMAGNDVPVATCVTSTNVNRGVLAFNDGTGATITKPSIQQTLLLPMAPTPATAGYVSAGPITVTLVWYGTPTTGVTRWCGAVVCRGDGEVDDNTVSFGTEVCVDDTAKATASQLNLATITLPTASTTTCAANELLHLRLARDSDHANDTMVGDASLASVTVAWQRSQ